MAQHYLKSTGKPIAFGPPLASGKEGVVCPVIGHPGLVAKLLFHPTPEMGDKLALMSAAPPPCLLLGGGYAEIIWPLDLVQGEDGSCSGYTMKQVRNKLPLESLMNPAICKQIDFGSRLRMAANIAWMVAELHAAGFVLGDLSASNILSHANTTVSFIDADSMQLFYQGRRFPCCVGRVEYLPPELHDKILATVERRIDQDYWALGVCVFQLLMEAHHPFQGKWLGSGHRPPLETRIAEGWWPYSDPPPKDWRPRMHAPPFNVLHPLLQDAFRQCFQLGHSVPGKRPTAEAWKTLLLEVEKDTAYLQKVVPLYKQAPWRNGTPAFNGTQTIVNVSIFRLFAPLHIARQSVCALGQILSPGKRAMRWTLAAAILIAILTAAVKYRTPIIKLFTPENKFTYSVEKYGQGKPTPKLWQVLRDSSEESP